MRLLHAWITNTCMMSQSVSTMYLTLGSLLILTSKVTGDLSWTKAPDNTSVQRGDSAVLFCQVSGLSATSIVIWQKGKSVLFIGHTRYDAPDRYQMLGDASRGEFNMKVTRADPSDDDLYECSAESSLRKTVQLRVIGEFRNFVKFEFIRTDI